MSRARVGKWGKNLAIRVPFEIAKASGLSDGERVEIEQHDGDILIRRAEAKAHARAEAKQAAEKIIAESHRYSLGAITIKELLAEGRRG